MSGDLRPVDIVLGILTLIGVAAYLGTIAYVTIRRIRDRLSIEDDLKRMRHWRRLMGR